MNTHYREVADNQVKAVVAKAQIKADAAIESLKLELKI
jgi:hypothetical protein